MTFRIAISTLFLGICLCSAQNLTGDQKVADLRQLSGLYAKQYGPYEWKRDTGGFDLMNLQPWIDRALKTTSDLEYLDLLVEYVASLNDAHDTVTFPFTFSANLGFSSDIYGGKVLIDSISRGVLPLSRYPFTIGDELVSVDGTGVEEWIRQLSRYSIAANPRSTTRSAASRISSRSQSRIPWAHRIGDTAEVVVRRASGDLETYTIPWNKSGVPVTEMGPVPSPAERAVQAGRGQDEFLRLEDSLAPWQKPLAYLLNASVPEDAHAVLSNGLRPIFAYPEGYQSRLVGISSIEAFTSGWWSAGGLRIGFLRIPTMSPSLGTSAALLQFEQEIAWMEQNTDGLVIDVMRNPGGSVLYVEQLCQRLTPYTFRSIGFELRATAAEVASFGATAALARSLGLSDDLVAGYEARYNEVLAAYRQSRGRTGPISLTQAGLMLEPARVVYTKPLIVLVDEFSGSGGDAFPATLQDNQRALIVGYRTMGAGGNVVDAMGATYSEAYTRVTRSLMNRKTDITTAEFPPAPYVENIGVRPDVVIDYMTRENLMDAGRPFVAAFTSAAVDYINKKSGN